MDFVIPKRTPKPTKYSKSLGSNTSVNVVRATFEACKKLMNARTTAKNRGKALNDMWG